MIDLIEFEITYTFNFVHKTITDIDNFDITRRLENAITDKNIEIKHSDLIYIVLPQSITVIIKI